MNDRTEVHLTIESRNERPDAVIAPMILITFVENALKYGVSSHVRSDIFIDLALDGDSLHFATRNPIVVRPAGKSGFGIANNTNGAITDYQALYANGSAGPGLYVALQGAEVQRQLNVALSKDTAPDGYRLTQSAVDAWPYHAFTGTVSSVHASRCRQTYRRSERQRHPQRNAR